MAEPVAEPVADSLSQALADLIQDVHGNGPWVTVEKCRRVMCKRLEVALVSAVGSETITCTKLMEPSTTCEVHAASILSEALAGPLMDVHALLLRQGAAGPAASELPPHAPAARRSQTQVLPVREATCSLG